MEQKIKYLEFIQSVVERMSQNSFQLNGWSVLLVSALFALSAVESNATFAILAFLPGIAFWGLDGYFLRQEALFRALYDRVRGQDETAVDFSMNTADVVDGVADWYVIMFSGTVLAFHGAIAAAIVAVLVIY